MFKNIRKLIASALLSSILGLTPSAQAQTTISQLPSAGLMQQTDILPIVRGGVTYKATPYTWPTSGNLFVSNGTSAPAGLAEVDGECVVGAGGVWTAATCPGSSGTTYYAGSGLSLNANTFSINGTTATADLNLFTSSLQGLAPASGGGTTNFLRADGTWAVPSGGSGGSPGGSSGQIQYNNSGSFGGLSAVPVSQGGNTYDAIVTASPYNASGYIAQTLTNSSGASSGSTVIPVASTTGFYAGHIAVVALAGSGGTKNFAGTIASVQAGTSITLSGTALTGAALNNAGPVGTQTSSTATQATIPAGYTVYELGSTTLSASASSGATALTFTNAATYSAGQGLFIAAGGTSGANLVTTITSVSGNTVNISPGISNASGVASGTYVQHDDSAAFLAAVNLGNYLKTVKIFVPDGYYQINGALQSGGSNAVIPMPTLDYWPGGTGSGGMWKPQTTVMITGKVKAPQMQDYLSPSKIAHTSGAIIQSNLGSTSNVFGGYDSNGLRNFTNVQLEIDNVTLRAYPNPNVVMVNAYYVESLKMSGWNADTGETGATTQPSNVSYDNFAIIGPAGENGGNNQIQHGELYGFYWGIMASEHTAIEHIRFDNDYYPEMFGSGVSQYGITQVDTEFDGCTHGIALNNNSYEIPFMGNLLNIEHQSTPSWVTNVDDVSDGNNLLQGFISLDTLSSPITIAGGINLHVVNSSSPAYPLATETFSALSNSHYATAPNGTHLYCSNCTATPTCAGSGNGALATMINSVWSCTGGLSAGGTVTASGSPSSGNVAAFTTSTNIAPATAANIVSLFSTCSGTQYLGADGNCHTASGSGTVTTSGSPASGNLAIFSGSTVVTNGSSTPTQGQIYRPIDAQTGTTYTTVLSDNGSMVTMNNVSANTITIPPNSSVAYPVGAEIDVCQIGAGLTTFAAGSGVTINKYGSTLALAGQYACATAKQLSTNTWILIGNL